MDYRDLIVYAGVATAAAGIWMLSKPAALIFVGMAIMAAGFFARRR